ncbi:MAG: nitrous oxide reductase accessory protein NosL [Pyrobaculum sp.]
MSLVAIASGAAVFFLPPRRENSPEIRLGVDKCAVCQMVIVDKRFAAVYRHEGRWEKFDDVICLLRYLKEIGRLDDIKNAYVYDYLSGRLVKASEAYFVITKKIPTPMGSGIVAFIDREQAAAYSEDGKIYTIEELAEKVLP